MSPAKFGEANSNVASRAPPHDPTAFQHCRRGLYLLIPEIWAAERNPVLFLGGRGHPDRSNGLAHVLPLGGRRPRGIRLLLRHFPIPRLGFKQQRRLGMACEEPVDVAFEPDLHVDFG